MSALYPVPSPVSAKVVARAALPYSDKVIFLPPASEAGVELPSLVMAPMMPPQGPRL